MKRYIDAEKTKRELLENEVRIYDPKNMSTEDAMYIIDEQPTADVKEVKRGHWNDVQYTYFGLKRYECSECSDDKYWKKRYLEHKESFCPNCGADMRGDTDGNLL